jgi:hypothetical protein
LPTFSPISNLTSVYSNRAFRGWGSIKKGIFLLLLQ